MKTHDFEGTIIVTSFWSYVNVYCQLSKFTKNKVCNASLQRSK